MAGLVSKMSVATIVLISILSIVANGYDTRIISGPHCSKNCNDGAYNANVAQLLDRFVHETKDVKRDHHKDYTYYHSYPNNDVGSVTGGATCDRHLWRLSCKSCLDEARSKLKKGCQPSFEASIELEDCSMWFKQIAPPSKKA